MIIAKMRDFLGLVRFSHTLFALPFALLGAALAAHRGGGWVAWPPVFLGLAVLFWVAGFDVIYACQDADFDRRSGLHSLPARLGVAGALRLAAASHAAMIMALVALGVSYPLGRIYFVGVGLA